MKKALLTGVNGQDGSYLAKLLLEKGYEVFGLLQRSTRYAFHNLDYLGVTNDVEFLDGDMTDAASLNRIVKFVQPHEVYNLAAQSFVGTSWEQPENTLAVNANGTLYLLEAVRANAPRARFYQASTSEMFGNNAIEGIQCEETAFHPRSPYAVAKLCAHWMTINYRESYGLFTSCGILFNHESPIRGLEFVTRKITDGVARIHRGLLDRIGLGNLDSRRDWGFAGDYVEAMWLMLQQEEPDNFAVCTGVNHSVRDFLDAAFRVVGIDDWSDRVYVDPRFKRPAELFELKGDPGKAKSVLGWEPRMSFEELVKTMVEADLERVEREKGE